MDNRELDALVAEKVLDYKKDDVGNLLPPNFVGTAWQALTNSGAPLCSTDIAAAWCVVEKLEQQNRCLCLARRMDYNSLWCADFEYWEDGKEDINELVCAQAETAPLAICLAALKAVGIELEAGEGEG